jgi:hypothetical protein
MHCDMAVLLSWFEMLLASVEAVRKDRRKETKHDNAVKVASLLNEVSSIFPRGYDRAYMC